MFITVATLSLALLAEPALRPPAVPLITTDPYFSIWSASDHLYDTWPSHWTGRANALQSMVRVDGTTYRLMGQMPQMQTAEQLSVEVLPTRTIYVLQAGPIEVTMVFMTPAFPDDLDLLSRPTGYLTYTLRATDGARHKVELYFDHSGELVIDNQNQEIVWSHPEIPKLTTIRMGSAAQPVLGRKGDDLRIDWGYLYTATPDRVDARVLDHETARSSFAARGALAGVSPSQPRPAGVNWPVAAFAFDLGEVGRNRVDRHMMFAYDDYLSIEFLGRRLPGYWNRNGLGGAGLLRAALDDYSAIRRRAERFDAELMRDLTAVGGEKYAQICALAFRQSIAGHKLVADNDGTPMWFSKENYSNGCIATVDLTYPTSPLPLLFSAPLTRALLNPMMEYAASEQWPFPFAPHDIGTYPLANGQVYGGGEESEENQMPVEESANLLIVIAALAHAEGDASYAEQHWPLLTQWAEYLRDNGIDPGNQLCTDDFAGHLAHNTNLAMKAVVALAGYARLCGLRGLSAEAQQWRQIAADGVQSVLAASDDGDHYRLAFDRPDTWSMKYNLVWDKLLSLDLLPPEVVAKEIAYYRTQLQPYGLPLDNRSLYTKTDWTVWVATMAANEDDWNALIDPIWLMLQETESRVPFTDWYWTNDAKQRGFQARPVIGGVFIKMLDDSALWAKWRARAAAAK